MDQEEEEEEEEEEKIRKEISIIHLHTLQVFRWGGGFISTL